MFEPIMPIIDAISQKGGRALLVGGAVRDFFLPTSSKDWDLEVYGLDPETLTWVLNTFGRVDVVGMSFGVLKVSMENGIKLDVSIPRRENKVGQGHRGFLVQPDPSMTPYEAAGRRDYTMNALAYDPTSQEILDFFGGREDILARRLRHTSRAFSEDPLRVLRGVQFAARFGMWMDPTTTRLCALMVLDEADLAQERIWGEWEKFTLRGVSPIHGLRVLQQTAWITRYPELLALVGCPQEPAYHPEGDVWVHTGHVVHAAAAIADRDGLEGDDRSVLMLAALCHDLGKPTTTSVQQGRITSYGHAEAGQNLTRILLYRIGAPERILRRVVPLVREHMTHCGYTEGVTAKAVRSLALRLHPERITMLARLVEADMHGRPPLPGGIPPAMQTIVDMATTLQVEDQPPVPIILGRHLLSQGIEPGPAMGELLRQIFAAQMEGAFTDLPGGLAFLEKMRER
jgi:tRNA nucleotidyltransferase (CCA-adding enzyme)